MREKISVSKTFWGLIKILCSDFSAHFIITILLGILHGTTSGLVVIYTQKFFETVQTCIQNDKFQIMDIIVSLLILGSTVIFEYVMIALHNSEIEKYSFMMDKLFDKKMYEHVMHLGSLNFESKEMLDIICKAEKGAKNATRFLNVLFIIVFSRIPYFIVISIFLAKISVSLVFILALIIVPQMLGHIIEMKNYREVENETIELQRLCKHYEQCIYDLRFAKETRYLGATEFFLEKYNNTLKKFNSKKKETEKRNFYIRLTAQFITFVGYCGIVIFLLLEAIHANISIASFVTIFTSLHTLFSNVNGLIMEFSFGVLREFAGVQNFISFIYDDSLFMNKEKYELEDTIELRNVSYKYPGQNRYVLNNISLKIKKGQTIALVGTNGAGKTTLAKLILGILPISKGELLWNDVDAVDIDNVKDSCSVVLQDFQKYYMSVKENIQIGQSMRQENDLYYSNLLRQVGLGKFEKKLDMVLLRKFGGTDLSIGQWQKIAIARALFKNSMVMLLDEPTSAIDPLEENRLNRLFSEIGQSRTLILITHRLSSAQIADQIVVIDNGNIICSGTHEQLMASNSFYKEMYLAQKNQYIMKENR